MNSTSSQIEYPLGERMLAAVADGITRMYGDSLAIQARIDIDVILKTVTRVIAERLPVTCTAILMKPDPETSRVVFADETNAGMADYLDAYIASLGRPGEAPTYGLARKVIENRGPMLLPSITLEQLQGMVAEQARHFSRAVPMPVVVDKLAVLMVPMRSGPAIIGTLGLFDWQAARAFTDSDIEWMQRTADRVGLAVENAQLRNKAMDRAERIAAMSDVGLAISAGQELRSTFKLILDRLSSTLHVDAADILVVDERERTVAVAASSGFRSVFGPELKGQMPTDAGKRWVVEHNVASTSEIEWIGQSRRWLLAREGLRTYTAAPLMVHDRFTGALEVFSRAELEPDDEWFSFLDAMGTMAAIALDSSSMQESREQGAGRVGAAARLPAPDLSERELQILRMVIEGASNREVAEQLHLSQNTVKFHVRQLLEKTEVANRTELATRAVHHGWV